MMKDKKCELFAMDQVPSANFNPIDSCCPESLNICRKLNYFQHYRIARYGPLDN